MVFSSMVFLCVFLPVVFLLYYMIPSLQVRNMLLILFSLLFYAYGEPVYVILMMISTMLNYIFGRIIGRSEQRFRKVILTFAVICNLGILAFFKYADMIIATGNTLFHMDVEQLGLPLPIGLSFFTFQAMSYVIDVYRGEVECQRAYRNVLLYISFFPQLIAGPIVKYHDIQEQITNRSGDLKKIATGLRRFITGLGKKVLISNTMAVAADAVFAAPVDELNACSAWIGALAYMMQIYFDFSGYSDMAIGLGHMFGFAFLENFQYPYISGSIKEFWRRWHISLSTWFKEYLYIPLGGNRKGRIRTYINKIIVFLCTGLWHGANWTFVVWGIFHGMFLLLEDILPVRKLPRILRHLYAVLAVCVGFVIFRADTLLDGFGMIGTMFTGWSFREGQMAFALEQLTPVFLLIFAAAVAGCTPIVPCIRNRVSGTRIGWICEPASYIVSVLLLLLCMFNLAGGSYNPFIYFRF